MMNTKQLVATGVLAAVIVASVALMPVNAETKEPRLQPARHSGMIAAARMNSGELPQDQVRDLTYN
jgi:hypothetical protein